MSSLWVWIPELVEFQFVLHFLWMGLEWCPRCLIVRIIPGFFSWGSVSWHILYKYYEILSYKLFWIATIRKKHCCSHLLKRKDDDYFCVAIIYLIPQRRRTINIKEGVDVARLFIQSKFCKPRRWNKLLHGSGDRTPKKFSSVQYLHLRISLVKLEVYKQCFNPADP